MTVISSTRVFIVSEPLRKDDGGDWGRIMDFSDATRFGELVYLLPPAPRVPQDPAEVIRLLETALASFTASDYLLPVGHPAHVAWAAAVAAQRCGGRLGILHWLPREHRYAPLRANCWPTVLEFHQRLDGATPTLERIESRLPTP